MTETLKTPPAPIRTSVVRGLLMRSGTLVAAALVAAAIWLIGTGAFGLALTVRNGSNAQTVGLASVILVPLTAGAAAWGLLAILEKTSRRGHRVWTIIAWTVLAVSVTGPVALGATGGVLATLLAMHLGVGVLLIVGLAGSGRDRNRVH